jgi:hypothetical protein
MNSFYTFRFIVAIFFVVGCSSSRQEEYVDYFYSYKNEHQLDSFTYILYIGEEGDRTGHLNRKEHSIEPERRRTKNSSNSRKRAGGNDSGEIVPVAFRMEEEAFERIEKLLESKNFCSNGVEYTSKDYTWLRYTIKGHCKA